MNEHLSFQWNLISILLVIKLVFLALIYPTEHNKLVLTLCSILKSSAL